MAKLTKIVATVGPASNTPNMIRSLIQSGVNVFRQNFSHGDAKQHLLVQSLIRSISNEEGIPVSILQDLAGPKIRTGSFENDYITLDAGKTFTLTAQDVSGNSESVSMNYPQLVNQLQVDNVIRLDDGKISLKVLEIRSNSVLTEVIEGGVIKSRRGINVPGIALDIEVLTEKDKENVEYFKNNQYDWISLSFTQKSEDIIKLRALLEELEITSKIIAKIETNESLNHLDDIISVSDGIMIARGDLAIETPIEQVPLVQKDIIAKCRTEGKPVIVATQMLESMIENSVPTRAEVSDIATAIFDGADAIMLSAETAIGKHAVKSVQAMAKVAQTMTESDLFKNAMLNSMIKYSPLSKSLYELQDSTIKGIVIVTQSGRSAKELVKLRPNLPVIAITSCNNVAHQLNLHHGIYPLVIPADTWPDKDDNIRSWILHSLKSSKLLPSNSKVIVSYGQSLQTVGGTDTITFLKI